MKSKEMRLLKTKWTSGTGWPKRVEWVEIEGLRGWEGQRVEFNFPMVVVCGENGSGKSTILQAAGSVYYQNKDQTDWYASDFFPETPWDKFPRAELRYSIRQGQSGSQTGCLRKFPDRWKGYDKRTQREVQYIDLARIQPIYSRTGYSRLAKPTVKESSATEFEDGTITRLSEIMGRQYSAGKLAVTDADTERRVPVVSVSGKVFSGFHQGAGEFNVAELLGLKLPKYSLLLIDEIETSLHPRAQRRLIRDLAEICRNLEIQIIMTTHSPYVLEEFPPEARCYILKTGESKEVVFGVSPEFSMTKMDEENYPECDLYVEDDRAKSMLLEILAAHAPDLVSRCQIISYGSASVGVSLGMMVKQNKFPRRSLVFLDGDSSEADGCLLLPGGDAPERVVFNGLKNVKWSLLEMRSGRDFTAIDDACSRAMTLEDHHQWIVTAAKELVLGSDTLWQMMTSSWATDCFKKDDAKKIIDQVRNALVETSV